ncbi:tyrosine-type recombinase/integrase [Lysinibacillus sp. NPDC096418]|uniref:tyrosine-type recombinase/integrase n=1 Tax=Lysinibacillus sp. NPDC096418 TaxID=3364138 RepID=UPI0037F35335
MEIIEFSINNGSGKCCIISINNVEITIKSNLIPSGLLREFILECEQLLVTQNINAIRYLPGKYGPRALHLFLKLSESAFQEEFYNCYNKYGSLFLEKGEFYSIKKFYDFISPGSPITNNIFDSFLHNAMENFYNEIALPYLRIAFNQRSKLKVYNVYKTLHYKSFFYLATEKLPHHYLVSYLHFCAKKCLEKGGGISFTGLCKLAFTRAIPTNHFEKTQFILVMEVVDYWKNKYFEGNREFQMNKGSSKWVLPYLDIQNIRLTILDFSNINYQLKIEFQEYLIFMFKKGENVKGLTRRFSHLFRVTSCMQAIMPDCTSFLSLHYVEVLQIYDNLKQLKREDGRNKYTLKTIQGSISEARLFFDWLKQQNSLESLKNPFRQIKFNNISSYVKNTEYIPEEVIEQLSIAISDSPLYVQRIWLIMMNTGLRVSEVLNLEENCLNFNEIEGIYYLNHLSSKTLKHRRRQGLDDYRTIPLLNLAVIEIIKQQIQESKQLRLIGETSYIFLKIFNNSRLNSQQNVTRHLASTIASCINNCIKRHKIKNGNGEIWNYTNHQCRKTIAVNLLGEGSSISEVGEILGHMEEKTTREYYQDIDAMKIAKLDQKLFEQLFDTIDEKTKSSYNPVELEQLKVEIMTGARETPEGHGSCVKHVSFGPCKKSSCVGCSLLLTGPQKLPMWKKLYSEQQAHLDKMIILMKAQGITDYENYRDYQAERHLLTLYESTISKIENFIKKRTSL